MMNLKDIKAMSKPVEEPAAVVFEWEDVKRVLAEEDPTFDPEEFDKQLAKHNQGTVEEVTAEVLEPEAELSIAVELLGRVYDFFLCVDQNVLKRSMPQAVWKEILSLDNDVAAFLNLIEPTREKD